MEVRRLSASRRQAVLRDFRAAHRVASERWVALLVAASRRACKWELRTTDHELGRAIYHAHRIQDTPRGRVDPLFPGIVFRGARRQYDASTVSIYYHGLQEITVSEHIEGLGEMNFETAWDRALFWTLIKNPPAV